jgi:predicted nucleic acid-binding protein
MYVLLDSSVLGVLTSPLKNLSTAKANEIERCTNWFYGLLAKGINVCTSEISDYEVRRELIRIKSDGLSILDDFRKQELIEFLPVTSEVLQKAAELWAEIRNKHISTADDKNIDADIIISAQWYLLTQDYPGQAIYLATKNIKHLRLIAEDYAQEWQNIS